LWPGHPATAHWGVEDPAAVEGTDIAKEQAFAMAARYLRNRIAAFVSLPIGSLDKFALETKLREIGQMDGESGGSR
jgi:arsenate reductase (thioredoxin)